MVESRWLTLTLAIGFAYWPLRRFATGHWSARTPVDWALVVLLLTLPVTMWATALPAKTLPQMQRLLAGVVLFYALVNWAKGWKRLRWSRDAAVGVGLLLAAAAPFVVQWNAVKLAFIPSELYARFRLLVADAANPNVMAGSLVLLLPLGAALLLFNWRGAHLAERGLGVAFLLLGGAILLLSQSRSAWLALGAALAVLVILRWRRGWLVVLGGGLALALLALLAGPQPLVEALVSSPTLGGLEGRLEVWSRAVYMIQDFPFTGIGMGAFTEVADRLYPFFLYAPGTAEHAHNLFLQVAVDLGIPGLVAWLAILLGSLAAAFLTWRASRHADQAGLAGMGAGLLAAQAALVVHGLSDAVVWGMVRPAPLVWLVWGLAAASLNFVRIREGEVGQR